MESGLLIARINDTAEICLRTMKPKFFGFLSAEQAVLADRLLQNNTCDYSFWGGYDGSDRVFLGCFPDWDDKREFPITSVTVRYRAVDKLSHRDFLGSLMGLGIKREAVGDILVGDDKTVIFLTDDVAEYVISQLNKVGRTGVSVMAGFSLPLPQSGTQISLSDTVASSRLDCVVSALAGLSRSAAVSLISDGLVTVNSVVCDKVTKNISENDILTVRGKGKFVIKSLDGRTRKNRVVLNYLKYM